MTLLLNRRQFVRATGLTALTATVPGFLHKTGLALAGDPRREVAPIPGLKDARVLIVVQLAGGNDGLNTLVPHGEDAYYRLRPKLGIEAKKVLKIDTHVGLHPELVELKKLYDDGSLALVQNVGYPNPDRSHFRATEIWETGSPADKTWTTGWLGRYFDAECAGARTPVLGLQLGERPALTFAHPRPRGVTLANPAILDWPARGIEAEAVTRINRIEKTELEALDFVQRTANETFTLSRQLRAAVKGRKSPVEYPPFAFCQTLKLVAQLIAAELPTRVFYVSLGGFDTHAAQANRHAALLQELSQGLAAFHADLKASGHLDRTLLLTFSEFGRRLAENRSSGTDHGTGNVLFLQGGAIKAGLHGTPPNLSKLDAGGDPFFTVDFRSVYAAVLRDWLNADAGPILDGKFESLALVKK